LALHHEMTIFHGEEKANAFTHVVQSKARVSPGALCHLMLGEPTLCQGDNAIEHGGYLADSVTLAWAPTESSRI
jgi:hypothetical protein